VQHTDDERAPRHGVRVRVVMLLRVLKRIDQRVMRMKMHDAVGVPVRMLVHNPAPEPPEQVCGESKEHDADGPFQ
jgi:hypothetical protein